MRNLQIALAGNPNCGKTTVFNALTGARQRVGNGLLVEVRPDAVVVERRVARWFAIQLFHLLGYRIHEEDGSRIILRRRRFDEATFVKEGPTPEDLR